MQTHALARQAEEALAVVQAVRAAVAEGRAADHALNALVRARRHYGSRDRRLFAALVFAYFRWKGWVEALPAPPRALAAAAWLDGIGRPDLLERWWPDLAGAPRPDPLPERGRALGRLSGGEIRTDIESLVPAWFAREWEDGRPAASLAGFVESLQRRPPLWLRCRAGARDEVLGSLREAGAAAAPDDRLPGLLRVDTAPSRAILAPLLHTRAEIQDIASQCVGHLCAPKPGEHWWDLCAGAGGKTLHLLDQLGGSGSVFCTDTRTEALDELTRRATAAGFTNWTARRLPPDPGRWTVGSRFDAILLDAPCAGTGTWGRAPDARWRTTREDCLAWAARQAALLRHALPRLKPGGRIVYAVCSLTRAETSDVFQTVARDTPIGAVPLRHPLTGAAADPCLILPAHGPGIGMWCRALEAIRA